MTDAEKKHLESLAKAAAEELWGYGVESSVRDGSDFNQGIVPNCVLENYLAAVSPQNILDLLEENRQLQVELMRRMLRLCSLEQQSVGKQEGKWANQSDVP